MTTDAPTAGLPPNHPDPSQDRAAAGNAPTRSGRLIGLVRRLIDFGKELVGILQQECMPTRYFDMTHNFATLNISLIMARIRRGLRVAAALESRLLRGAFRLDNPPPPRAVTAAAPRAVRSTRRRHPVRPISSDEDDAILLDGLPTAQEIAARLRRHSIGDVIADICNDLGIVATHPLWRELYEAVVLNNGSLMRLARNVLRRAHLSSFLPPEPELVPPAPPRPSAAAPWPPVAAATGPP